MPWHSADAICMKCYWCGQSQSTYWNNCEVSPQWYCANTILPLKSGISHSLSALLGYSVYLVALSCGTLYELSCSPAAMRETGDLADSNINRAGKPERQFLFLALLVWIVVRPSVSHRGGLATHRGERSHAALSLPQHGRGRTEWESSGAKYWLDPNIFNLQ